MADMTYRQLAEAVAAMGGATVAALGLRFDRVAVRVLDRLQRGANAGPNPGASVALTLTAPIRAPGKTAGDLQQEVNALLRTGRAGNGRRVELHGNRAELRLVTPVSARRPSLLGFVHNPDIDASTILALAEQWLRFNG
jgi:hypothetical protein